MLAISGPFRISLSGILFASDSIEEELTKIASLVKHAALLKADEMSLRHASYSQCFSYRKVNK